MIYNKILEKSTIIPLKIFRKNTKLQTYKKRDTLLHYKQNIMISFDSLSQLYQVDKTYCCI